jgi:2-keto-4-pentenoate hydratase/2-oxohepta-3-ene-1,7-dioic acid hydratase in catechol pathway
MKIICIGRNYADHAVELHDGAEIPREPLFFLKPDTALLRNNDPFYIPSFSNEVHYECELVVRITRLAKCIDEKFASRCYEEVGLGIDFTARDLQREAIAKGLPWELCKGFDGSAVLGDFVPVERFAHMQNIRFHLDIDGRTVQQGHTVDMLFGVDELVSYVSQFFMLKTGDLIFTGTPVGVGPLQIGQHIEGFLEGERVLAFNIR